MAEQLPSRNSVSGPRADADWPNATVTIYVPVHGTAQTTMATWSVTLPELAALLRELASDG